MTICIHPERWFTLGDQQAVAPIDLPAKLTHPFRMEATFLIRVFRNLH